MASRQGNRSPRSHKRPPRPLPPDYVVIFRRTERGYDLCHGPASGFLLGPHALPAAEALPPGTGEFAVVVFRQGGSPPRFWQALTEAKARSVPDVRWRRRPPRSALPFGVVEALEARFGPLRWGPHFPEEPAG
jgi:hypothetical protein